MGDEEQNKAWAWDIEGRGWSNAFDRGN